MVEHFHKDIQKMADKISDHLLAGLTSSTPSQPPPLTLERLGQQMREWEKLARNYRKSNVTFIVDQGHSGPMLISEHPTDGRFVECSYDQAKQIDLVYPLRFVRVLAEDRAEFEVATPLDGIFVPLLRPPYELRMETPDTH